MPHLSVIIPTYNNRAALARTLPPLLAQDFPADQFEIIVLDDGSTDGTREMVTSLTAPVPVHYHWQPNRGRSAARNAGARLARGRILLFLDSDILAGPELLGRHYRYYERHDGPIGVQGRTLIHPDSKTTLFMRTRELTPDLTQRRRHDLSPYQLVTRNLSMRTEDLWAAGGFDETFVGYGWEDIDLGLRLRARGVRFFYDPETVGYDCDARTLDQTLVKARQAGESVFYFWQKHGRGLGMGLFLEVHPALLPLKWLIYRAGPYGRLARRALRWAEQTENPWVASECYAYLFWEAYYDGAFEARRRAHVAEPRIPAADPSGNDQHPSPSLPPQHPPLPETAHAEP